MSKNTVKMCSENSYKMSIRVYLQDCAVPVSYTHLDVYKRQLLKSGNDAGQERSGTGQEEVMMFITQSNSKRMK